MGSAGRWTPCILIGVRTGEFSLEKLEEEAVWTVGGEKALSRKWAGGDGDPDTDVVSSGAGP